MLALSATIAPNAASGMDKQDHSTINVSLLNFGGTNAGEEMCVEVRGEVMRRAGWKNLQLVHSIKLFSAGSSRRFGTITSLFSRDIEVS